MNRKSAVIGGVVIILLILGVAVIASLSGGGSDEKKKPPPALGLAYCGDEQVKPCVVSFGIDADDNMLVNLLLPDASFPDFHLKIVRGESETSYQCQRLSTGRNNAYCIGEKMPPGEVLHLMLISSVNEILLAEGDLTIIGLAFSEPEIAVPTPTGTPTGIPTSSITVTATVSPTPTQTPRVFFPTPTRTKPSYPSYP